MTEVEELAASKRRIRDLRVQAETAAASRETIAQQAVSIGVAVDAYPDLGSALAAAVEANQTDLLSLTEQRAIAVQALEQGIVLQEQRIAGIGDGTT